MRFGYNFIYQNKYVELDFVMLTELIVKEE